MKKLFRSKKFVGISSLVLATSLVVGTIAIRRSKDGNGFKIGSSTVYADGSLLDYDSASLINYSTILGRAIDYGILSDTLDQKGHMETTYATNKFINPQAANNCDVDLAGSKPAQFIIASVENGSYARFGQTYAMSEMDFVIDTTYDMSAHEDDYFVYDDSCKANVLYRTYDYSVLKQNVDSMIGKIVKQSDILAAKRADPIWKKRSRSLTDFLSSRIPPQTSFSICSVPDLSNSASTECRSLERILRLIQQTEKNMQITLLIQQRHVAVRTLSTMRM